MKRDKQRLIVRIAFYGMFLLPSVVLYFLIGIFLPTTNNTGIIFSQRSIVVFYFFLMILCILSTILVIVYLSQIYACNNARTIKIYTAKKSKKDFYLSFLSFVTPSITNIPFPPDIQIWFLSFFYIVGGILFISGEMISFQPLLSLFSYSIYDIEYKLKDDGVTERIRRDELIIKKSDLQEDDQISFMRISTNTIIGFNCKEKL